MIDFRPLIKPSFWFDLSPEPLTQTMETTLFIVFGAMIVIGALIRIVARSGRYSKEVARVARMIANMMIVYGIVGLIIYFFAFEGAYILGARFWFLAWFLALVYSSYALWRRVRVEIPREEEEARLRSEKNKYLPRRSR